MNTTQTTTTFPVLTKEESLRLSLSLYMRTERADTEFGRARLAQLRQEMMESYERDREWFAAFNSAPTLEDRQRLFPLIETEGLKKVAIDLEPSVKP